MSFETAFKNIYDSLIKELLTPERYFKRLEN